MLFCNIILNISFAHFLYLDGLHIIARYLFDGEYFCFIVTVLMDFYLTVDTALRSHVF